MKNETLTRKQNQKPCDLTSPICTSLAGPHTVVGPWTPACKDAGSGGVPGAA